MDVLKEKEEKKINAPLQLRSREGDGVKLDKVKYSNAEDLKQKDTQEKRRLKIIITPPKSVWQ